MRGEYRHADAAGPYKLIPLAKSGTAHSPRPNLVYEIQAVNQSGLEVEIRKIATNAESTLKRLLADSK